MSAADLIAELRLRGVAVQATGDRLKVDAPKGTITPELHEALKDHKLEIIALLMTGDTEIAWRAAVMASQIPAEGYVPLLVAREAVEPEPGHCISCGNRLNADERYICSLCGRAKNVAIEIAIAKPASTSNVA